MDLRDAAQQLECEPFLLDLIQTWNSMHLFPQIVADELPHGHDTLLRYRQNFIVSDHVRVPDQIERAPDPIYLALERLEPLLVDALEVHLADHGPLILNGGKDCLE